MGVVNIHSVVSLFNRILAQYTLQCLSFIKVDKISRGVRLSAQTYLEQDAVYVYERINQGLIKILRVNFVASSVGGFALWELPIRYSKIRS